MPSTITVTHDSKLSTGPIIINTEFEDDNDSLQIALTDGGQLAIVDNDNEGFIIAAFHGQTWYRVVRD